MNNETIEMNVEQETVEKVYTFRKLQSTDMFLMFKILSKIGIDEFTEKFGQENINKLVISFFKNKTDNGEQPEKTDNGEQGANVKGVFVDVAAGVSGVLGIVDTLLCNLSKCENEVFEMLANTSNLDVEQVKTLDFVTFTEMVIDFVKKDEFKGFIKVVLKSFKQGN